MVSRPVSDVQIRAVIFLPRWCLWASAVSLLCLNVTGSVGEEELMLRLQARVEEVCLKPAPGGGEMVPKGTVETDLPCRSVPVVFAEAAVTERIVLLPTRRGRGAERLLCTAPFMGVEGDTGRLVAVGPCGSGEGVRDARRPHPSVRWFWGERLPYPGCRNQHPTQSRPTSPWRSRRWVWWWNTALKACWSAGCPSARPPRARSARSLSRPPVLMISSPLNLEETKPDSGLGLNLVNAGSSPAPRAHALTRHLSTYCPAAS